MAPDPLVGRRLANYHLKRVLARGGMAQIYLGRDVSLNRPVAVKVIDARYRDNPDYAERFVREARLVATWHHPHIIHIFYADDQDGLYFYAMEFVDGLDLASLIQQYNQDGLLLPHADVLRIGRAVGSALDYAHRQGVIHRDVKPSNVMVSQDGRVLLGDFGLAMDVAVGSLGEVFGSPHYMAPEQARHSASAVPASDLYALGVMLYEMLTGVVPFDDPAPATLALQHITAPPPPPREVNPAVGAATEGVLLRALSKLPDERYASGAALLDALDDALTQDGAEGERDAQPLPAPPAAISGANLSGANTRSLTVSERIALHLAGQEAAQADRPLTRLRGAPAAQGRQAALLAAALALMVTGVLLVVLAFNNRQATAAGTAPPLTALPTQPRGETPVPTVPPAIVQPPPTDTPAPTPSPTLPPTPTPPPAPSAAPLPAATVLYPDGKLIRLVYNAGGFYLLNLSSGRIDVTRLAFEAIPPAGTLVTYRFEGAEWAEFFPFVTPDHCNYVELFRLAQTADRPAVCREINASRADIDPDNALVFWLPRPGLTHFRVLWNEGEIARCELVRGRCDAYLP